MGTVTALRPDGDDRRRQVEQALLSAILYAADPYFARYAAGRLRPDDFVDLGHGQCFALLVDTLRRHGRIEPVALGGTLAEAAADNGWAGQLNAIGTGRGHPEFIVEYVNELTAGTEAARIRDAAQQMLDDPASARDVAHRLLEEPARADDVVLSVSDMADGVFDTYDRRGPDGISTGWKTVDRLFRVPESYITVVSGWTHHGKSTFLDALLVNVSESDGLRHLVWSPENWPYDRHHLPYLAQRHARAPFHDGPKMRMDEQNLADSLAWIERHFRWIHPGRARTTADIFTAAESELRRWPYDTLMIDPFTDVQRERGVDMREFIWDFLGDCRTFVDRHGIHVIVVAHPRKPQQGQKGPPSVYDVAESANWGNRADLAVMVHRHDDRRTLIETAKVRHATVGRIGRTLLKFDPATTRFSEVPEWERRNIERSS